MIPNINHPTVVAFMLNVSNHIQETLTLKEYFNLTSKRRNVITSAAFKMVKNSIPNNVKFTDEQIKSFLHTLLVKNEEIENYELSAVMKNILDNYDSLNKPPTRRPKKTTKKSGEQNEL